MERALAALTVALVASSVSWAAPAPPQGPSLFPAGGISSGPVLLAWSGVKAVAETLSSKEADATAPVALAEGLNGGVYVQWSDPTGTTLTRFVSTGLAQQTIMSHGGRGGRGIAVPTCVKNGTTQDCPVLPVDTDTPDPGVSPEVVIWDCANSVFDWSLSSALGTLIPAGGSRMFLAARFNAWSGQPPAAGPDTMVMVTPLRIGQSTPCVLSYAESELYSGTSLTPSTDGYSKGRLLSLGLPSTLQVTAAGRMGANGMVVAGSRGGLGSGWAVTLDDSFAPVNQINVSVPSALGVVPSSVAADSAGHLFLCGTISALSINGLVPGWVSQSASDLSGLVRVDLPLTIHGCAVTPQGALVVSGRYSGTYNGQTSNGGTDLFLALFTPGAGSSPPVLTQFAHYGSTSTESNISAPLVTAGGSLFVAGVTTGDWGAAVGVAGHRKVFVARFDPVTLALK